MPEDGKKIAIGVGVALGLGGLAFIFLSRRGEAKPPPPELVIENLVISPSEVDVGEPVSITVDVTNIGDETLTYQLTCEVL